MRVFRSLAALAASAALSRAPASSPGNYVMLRIRPRSFDPLEPQHPAPTMRLAHRLLMAAPASIGSKSSLSEALAIPPPLQLYRRILRAHRRLDPELRVLGDSYVKKEFRAHRTAENPLHIVCGEDRSSCFVWRESESRDGIGFLTEWQLYVQKMENDNWAGERLDKAKLDKLSDQQLGQLYELMEAIKNPEKGEGENGEGEKQ
ncbi:Succinate dehydrogenase assembly factor 3 [Penicillium diatomitis]|uniref:Succinate dehydrogenase assembly factor 3 n=1 Tax=Penicillium diatomitis TaxID=2819901 RepID=A0A9W9XNI1_9EURO|nr:Succinate dehydrogenase assembly factor 3 [Penicillium diatomitis]KAJ5495840.1 Succinate dehydrogenase assembly factor 3 [Penicillium diatomitis]